MIELVGKYTTGKIFADTIEEGVYGQVYDIINCPAFKDQKVVCMPDVHVGASGPCGLVATIGDYICPEHIGVDIGCFTENTKVELTDGRQLTFKELINEYNEGKENFCYSINDNGNISITKINKPSYTKTVNDLCIIELDNNKIIECTLDHKFMLRNGSYKMAKDLNINDSLMPLYIDNAKNQKENLISYWKELLGDYKVIYDPLIGKYIFIHYLSDEYNNRNNILRKFDETKWVRHHVDFNKFNNNPTNVQRYGFKEHYKVHYNQIKITNELGLTGFKRAAELHPDLYSKAGSIGMSKNWQNEDFRKRHNDRIIKENKEGKRHEWSISDYNKKRVAKMGKDIFQQLSKNPEYNIKANLSRSLDYLKYLISLDLELTEENFIKHRKDIINGKKKYLNSYSYNKLIKELKNRNCWNGTLDVELLQKAHDNIIIHIDNSNESLYKNHKIKSIHIEHKPNTKVYCLLNQEYNNFALSAGVFVHNCSVSMMILDKKVPEDKYAEFERHIKNKIPFGFNLNSHVVIDEKNFRKFLTQGFNKYRNFWPEMLMDLPDQVTEKWISDQLKRLNMDEGVFYKSLSSVGGGNHFIEYDEQEDGDLAGVTLHFGSRNFGVKVCKYWMQKTTQPMSKDEMKDAMENFKKEYKKTHSNMKEFQSAKDEFIKKIKENHINGYLSGEYMKGYLRDMCFAQLYAQYNHISVQKAIKELLIKYGIKEVRTIMSTHNFVDLHDHTLRKSAIRSYIGEEMLVPFNMRDGVAICEGLSNPEWLNSCAHGAGRKMSRSKAKENVSMDEFKESMKNVYSTTVCKGTIDESPMAYKDTNEIKDLIQETCKIKFMMIPKINIKAADGGD